MPPNINNLKDRLIEVLSQEKGYFGRVNTWGQRPTKYEYIGYELSEDLMPTLEAMTDPQRVNLGRIINYFEIHVNPLRKLLDNPGANTLYDFYSEIAWCHFMIVVMFGMLEIAAKQKPGIKLTKKGDLADKGAAIKSFLEDNLSLEKKVSIARRYSVEEIFGNKEQPEDFEAVYNHLWSRIRCGFIHEGGFETKGMEWHQMQGMGTKKDPIKIKSDVPMQEWLQITWESILHFYGYTGTLRLPRYT